MGCTHSKKTKAVCHRENGTLAQPSSLPEVLLTPQNKTPVVLLPPPARPSQEDLVSAPAAQAPVFEETVKEVLQQQKITQLVEVDSGESNTFHWPTAYEVRPINELEPMKQTTSQLAQRAAEDKMAFLEERIREKNKRKQTSYQEHHDEDDTLFELPVRMPDVDFSTEKHSVF